MGRWLSNSPFNRRRRHLRDEERKKKPPAKEQLLSDRCGKVFTDRQGDCTVISRTGSAKSRSSRNRCRSIMPPTEKNRPSIGNRRIICRRHGHAAGYCDCRKLLGRKSVVSPSGQIRTIAVGDIFYTKSEKIPPRKNTNSRTVAKKVFRLQRRLYGNFRNRSSRKRRRSAMRPCRAAAETGSVREKKKIIIKNKNLLRKFQAKRGRN